MSDEPTWRDRFPDGWATCVRCLEVHDTVDLDRLLWCADCRFRARERAARWGWIVGLAFALGLGVWVWFTVRPTDMIAGAWAATFAAAVWIGSRVGREFAYGVMRFQNARAVDAVPPSGPSGEVLPEDDAPPG